MTATLPPSLPPTILRRKQVEARTGLSRSTIYEKINRRSPRYDHTFPRPVRLGADAVGWIESEINAWIHLRMKYRQL
jgi:prophage regulatory protein